MFELSAPKVRNNATDPVQALAELLRDHPSHTLRWYSAALMVRSVNNPLMGVFDPKALTKMLDTEPSLSELRHGVAFTHTTTRLPSWAKDPVRLSNAQNSEEISTIRETLRWEIPAEAALGVDSTIRSLAGGGFRRQLENSKTSLLVTVFNTEKLAKKEEALLLARSEAEKTLRIVAAERDRAVADAEAARADREARFDRVLALANAATGGALEVGAH